MKPVVLGTVVVSILAAGAALTVATLAAAQRPDASVVSKFAPATYLPVGVGSDANGTTAWFIDTTNNRVIACNSRGCSAHSIPVP